MFSKDVEALAAAAQPKLDVPNVSGPHHLKARKAVPCFASRIARVKRGKKLPRSMSCLPPLSLRSPRPSFF